MLDGIQGDDNYPSEFFVDLVFDDMKEDEKEKEDKGKVWETISRDCEEKRRLADEEGRIFENDEEFKNVKEEAFVIDSEDTGSGKKQLNPSIEEEKKPRSLEEEAIRMHKQLLEDDEDIKPTIAPSDTKKEISKEEMKNTILEPEKTSIIDDKEKKEEVKNVEKTDDKNIQSKDETKKESELIKDENKKLDPNSNTVEAKPLPENPIKVDNQILNENINNEEIKKGETENTNFNDKEVKNEEINKEEVKNSELKNEEIKEKTQNIIPTEEKKPEIKDEKPESVQSAKTTEEKAPEVKKTEVIDDADKFLADADIDSYLDSIQDLISK